ncbi:hypothetical protein CKO15_05080 [Halorhodospira abdelmalekii]|uniref:STAS domain-containing protein n=1 Tax=Halorhodospira abdelmalekii TaxID=421629 RepID=UPI0019050428|nr:STAS domain-containing protein [Halorhodospira abdelmalekii]MBK1734669.1 hypothetical protein [Halorhodospira abdelmalekii]
MGSETLDELLDLGEQLDITVAAACKQRLNEALGGGQPIELKGDRLQRVDTAGVQLLLAFARAAADGPGWGWHGGEVPEAVRTAAQMLGVERELQGHSV